MDCSVNASQYACMAHSPRLHGTRLYLGRRHVRAAGHREPRRPGKGVAAADADIVAGTGFAAAWCAIAFVNRAAGADPDAAASTRPAPAAPWWYVRDKEPHARRRVGLTDRWVLDFWTLQ